jgi:AcrR family transcriptional regulator
MPVNLLLALRLPIPDPRPPATALAAAVRPVRAVGGHPQVTRLLLDVVGMKPQSDQLPGGALLQNLMDGLQFWALALALVGLVIGAAAWALGSHGQNYQQTYIGRRAVLISGLAALLIGAGPGIVNFFYTAGTGVH